MPSLTFRSNSARVQPVISQHLERLTRRPRAPSLTATARRSRRGGHARDSANARAGLPAVPAREECCPWRGGTYPSLGHPPPSSDSRPGRTLHTLVGSRLISRPLGGGVDAGSRVALR